MGQPRDVVAVSACSVNYVAAVNISVGRSNSFNTSVADFETIQLNTGGKTNAFLAALMRIGHHDRTRCHVAIRWTPKYRFDVPEIHLRPLLLRFIRADQRNREASVIRSLLQGEEFARSAVAERDPNRAYLAPFGPHFRILLKFTKDLHRMHRQ